MSDENEQLKKKILALEDELKIKNAELLRYRTEIVKINQTLEKVMADMSQELHMAQTLQKYLTPTELPNISGLDWSTKFNPGTQFGGDYFDIFEHEDKFKFGILLSSASGYSMSSLLLGVFIKMSSQIEARKGLAPHVVVQKIISEVAPQMTQKDSASLFYGVIDRRTFDFEYCSVGENIGIIQRAGKDALAEIKAQSKIIKKDFNEVLASEMISLNSNDRIAIASTGLVNATNRAGEPFGKERFSGAIRKAPRQGVHELRNEILYQSEQFTGLKNPNKDQTVIVFEVKEKVLKLAKNK